MERRLAACVCVFHKINIERRSRYHCSRPSCKSVDMQLTNCDMSVSSGTHASMLDDSAQCRTAEGRWHDEKMVFYTSKLQNTIKTVYSILCSPGGQSSTPKCDVRSLESSFAPRGSLALCPLARWPNYLITARAQAPS